MQRSKVSLPLPLLFAAFALAFFSSCGSDPANSAAYPWSLPANFPEPRVPADNPMSAEKALLGRYLFFDRRLSFNQTQSCGSCHLPSRAFTDGRDHAVGSTGMMHRRNAMGLTNVAYLSALTWASNVVRTLEQQALLPLFGDNPVELGMQGHEDELLARLRSDARYPAMFRASFPDATGDPITVGNLVRAIACFERTLISLNSPFDRSERGDRTALSDAARRGQELFNSERLECYHCHTGFNFTESTLTVRSRFDETAFHNTGLYNVDGMGSYPRIDQGLFDLTNRSEDRGAFRTMTLRNIELTAPYMHDGSVATLDEAIDHYAAGGRTIASGPNAGVGARSPLKNTSLVGFTLTPQEREDLLAFLRSLTDTDFVRDPRFSDPFGNER